VAQQKKAMTKAQIVAHFAEKLQVSKQVVKSFFDELVALAIREAKNGFTVPGLGKLRLKDRKARKGRNPKTGETIHIPAKKVLKFRVAKALRMAVVPPKPVKSKKTPPKTK